MKNFGNTPSKVFLKLAWYKAKVLEHNPIGKFLGHLSIECQLSQYYTNHCFRVIGITNFKRSHCSDMQIMAVSGHKSITSLALYQPVSNDKKNHDGNYGNEVYIQHTST